MTSSVSIPEQVIILGQGAQRMSAQGLKKEIEAVNAEIRQELKEHKSTGNKNYLLENLPEEIFKYTKPPEFGKIKKS